MFLIWKRLTPSYVYADSEKAGQATLAAAAPNCPQLETNMSSSFYRFTRNIFNTQIAKQTAGSLFAGSIYSEKGKILSI
ncbi:hypothetical protein BWI96_19295 [Siphonobacter sp. SORGH_AS_0500]|uniref:hypothetical protein n=1 Tax=Siphonobacter sp. SORGH_AS_0500 TaxID=1864824 RepID=UPI000CC18739|nr:hypothetical protein [Siphonobacter sp. SORGH_AS_0500]PKK34977.1 hypothetical protein BWI96_19295 [Siphonobacter sp. SORGH_AS_0500]